MTPASRSTFMPFWPGPYFQTSRLGITQGKLMRRKENQKKKKFQQKMLSLDYRKEGEEINDV